MNKLEQIEHLKISIELGIHSEIQSMIEDLKLKDIFEYHIQDDCENGVYDKLNDDEIEKILSNIETTIELKIENQFNLCDTF